MTSEYLPVGPTLVNTAPPPKSKKPDPTFGYVLIFIAGLALACALIWVGWQGLKRAADPYASSAQPIYSDPSTVEALRISALTG